MKRLFMRFLAILLSFSVISQPMQAAPWWRQLGQYSAQKYDQALGYAKQKWNKAQQATAAYTACITRKTPCTPEQKKKLAGAAIAALAAAVVVAGVVYNHYQTNQANNIQKQINNLPAFDAWTVIFKAVDNYAKIMIPELKKGKVTSFDVAVITNFSNKVTALTQQEKEKIRRNINTFTDPTRGTLQALLARVGEVDKQATQTEQEYYKTVQTPMTDNLQGFNRPTVDTVYTFLGYQDNASGMQASHDQVNRIINQKNLEPKLKRQLGYYFGTAEQKKLYDAFLQGPGALNKFKPQGVTQPMIEQTIATLTSLIQALQELESALS